jgi:hypothetical protein
MDLWKEVWNMKTKNYKQVASESEINIKKIIIELDQETFNLIMLRLIQENMHSEAILLKMNSKEIEEKIVYKK